MKRLWFGFLHAIALMLSVMLSPVFAQERSVPNGAEPEIVGKLEIPVNGWQAEFALDMDTGRQENQHFVLWSEEVGRQMEFAVQDIAVADDGSVRWQAQCTFDSLGGSHVGRWLVVELQPATDEEPERIGWDWSSGYEEARAAEMLQDQYAFPFLWEVQQGAVSMAVTP